MNHRPTPWLRHFLTLARQRKCKRQPNIFLRIHMGLIKTLASVCHYSDKWLHSGNPLAGGQWRKDGAERIKANEKWLRVDTLTAHPLTTLRRSLDSFLTTTPSPLSSLNMLTMSLHENPQTDWMSEYRRGESNEFSHPFRWIAVKRDTLWRGWVSPLAGWPV